jgi:hypothetical protein
MEDETSRIKQKISCHRHVRSMSSNSVRTWTQSAPVPKLLRVDFPISEKPKKDDVDGPFYEINLNEEVKPEHEPELDKTRRSSSKKIITTIKDIFVKSPRKSEPEVSTGNKFSLNLPGLKDSPTDSITIPTPRDEIVSPREKIVSPREDFMSTREDEELLRIYKKGKWWDFVAKTKREVEKLTLLRLYYDDYKRNDSLLYINKTHEECNPHLTTSQHLIIETISTFENPKVYQYFLTVKYLMIWEKASSLDDTLDFTLVDYYIIVHYSFDDKTMENLDVDYYYPRSFFVAPIPHGIFDGLSIYPITINNGKLKIKFCRSDINPLTYLELKQLFHDGKYRRIIDERRKTTYYINFILFSSNDFILSSFDLLKRKL